MLQPLIDIDISQLITEDDESVDNFLTEKQERLLTEPLYSCWKPHNNRSFLVAANVGVFNSIYLSAIVPDVFLSMDVEIPDDWWEKEKRSYFNWEFGKPPNLVIEIVSNKVGEENTKKITRYAQMGVTYYVIFDPYKKLSDKILTFYVLPFGRSTPTNQTFFPEIGLGLIIWEGEFENTVSKSWLRWCNEQGQIIPSGIEKAEIQSQRADEEKRRADEEKQRTDEEKRRADEEKQRADEEKQRAERLAAKLRELGIDTSYL
ncbi:MAG: hypothetical protein FD167_1820 [bacterium]|nr:MAG: hypothetical protein FD167_1820 [bacterium]